MKLYRTSKRNLAYGYGLTLLLATPAVASPVPRQTAAPVAATVSAPAYDVVSIKPNKTGSRGTDIDIDNGNFEAKNVTLKVMIQNAYGLKEAQLEGLPAWGKTSRFDIKAKIVEPDKKLMDSLSSAQSRAMLQPILLERFQLKFHRETKVLPVYELVVAKGGPKFAASAVKQGDGKTVKGMSAGSMSVHNTNLTAVGIPLEHLASQLSTSAQRMVVDRTGLTGDYDFELKWSPDDGPPVDAEAPPSLFTALTEQLGLKLQPSRAPVDTFIVDHAEVPVED